MCERKWTKKYIQRDSPPYPGNECRGLTMLGNDGQLWISEPNSANIWSWKPVDHRLTSRKPKSRKSRKPKSRKSRKPKSRKSQKPKSRKSHKQKSCKTKSCKSRKGTPRRW